MSNVTSICGSPRGAGDVAEIEAAEQAVVLRELALALQHVDRDGVLIVAGGGEDFGFAMRDRGITRHEHGHHAAERLDAQAERSGVEDEDLLHLASGNARLDRRADRHDFIGVDGLIRLLAFEQFLDQLLDHRHAGGTADEKHFLDLLGIELRIL